MNFLSRQLFKAAQTSGTTSTLWGAGLGATAGAVNGAFSDSEGFFSGGMKGAVLGAAGGVGYRAAGHRFMLGVQRNADLLAQRWDEAAKINPSLANATTRDAQMQMLGSSHYWDGVYTSPEAHMAHLRLAPVASSYDSVGNAFATKPAQSMFDDFSWFNNTTSYNDAGVQWAQRVSRTFEDSVAKEKVHFAKGYKNNPRFSGVASNEMAFNVGHGLHQTPSASWESDPLMKPYFDNHSKIPGINEELRQWRATP